MFIGRKWIKILSRIKLTINDEIRLFFILNKNVEIVNGQLNVVVEANEKIQSKYNDPIRDKSIKSEVKPTDQKKDK